MSKPILYSYFRSSASWRVRIALAFKGIDYEYRCVHLIKDGGEQHKPEYREINPMGTVPSLEIDGTTLTDSIAIMEYLDETKEGPKLLPQDPILRAKARALAGIVSSGIQPIQNLRVLQYIGSEPHKLDKVEWAKKWIADGLAGFEKSVSKTAGEFCVGDSVTIADICLVPQMYNAIRFKVDLDNFPNIKRIVGNCQKLQQFKAGDAHAQPDTLPELKDKPWNE